MFTFYFCALVQCIALVWFRVQNTSVEKITIFIIVIIKMQIRTLTSEWNLRFSGSWHFINKINQHRRIFLWNVLHSRFEIDSIQDHLLLRWIALFHQHQRDSRWVLPQQMILKVIHCLAQEFLRNLYELVNETSDDNWNAYGKIEN